MESNLVRFLFNNCRLLVFLFLGFDTKNNKKETFDGK